VIVIVPSVTLLSRELFSAALSIWRKRSDQYVLRSSTQEIGLYVLSMRYQKQPDTPAERSIAIYRKLSEQGGSG